MVENHNLHDTYNINVYNLEKYKSYYFLYTTIIYFDFDNNGAFKNIQLIIKKTHSPSANARKRKSRVHLHINK